MNNRYASLGGNGGGYFYKQEFNDSKLKGLGGSVHKMNPEGTEVEVAFQYNLLGKVTEDKLLGMVRQSNPDLHIHYSKRTTGDTSQVKETEKPVWDFEISEDGKTIKLKRT